MGKDAWPEEEFILGVWPFNDSGGLALFFLGVCLVQHQVNLKGKGAS